MANIYNFTFEGIQVMQSNDLSGNQVAVNLPSYTFLKEAQSWDEVHQILMDNQDPRPIRFDMGETIYAICQAQWAKDSGIDLNANADTPNPNSPGAPSVALNATRPAGPGIRGFGIVNPGTNTSNP